MSEKKFLFQLGSIIIGSIILLISLSRLEAFSSSSSFSWIILVLFIILTVYAYYRSKKLATHSDNNAFSRMVLGFIGIKVVLCLGLMLSYAKFWNPNDKMVLIPFLILYSIYTIFEVSVMTKNGQIKVGKNVEG